MACVHHDLGVAVALTWVTYIHAVQCGASEELEVPNSYPRCQ